MPDTILGRESSGDRVSTSTFRMHRVVMGIFIYVVLSVQHYTLNYVLEDAGVAESAVGEIELVYKALLILLITWAFILPAIDWMVERQLLSRAREKLARGDSQ